MKTRMLAVVASVVGFALCASAKTIDLSSLPAEWGNKINRLKYSDSNITLTGTLCRDAGLSLPAGKTLTLSNATVKSPNTTFAYCFDKKLKWAGITCEGDATIILEGDNYVEGFYRDYPGIYVPEGCTLTIKGEGSLTACASGFEGDGMSHGYAAGIGGGWADDVKNSGNIVIESGTVTANGGFGGAGIGAGPKGRSGTITITGGKVVATGGMMQGTTEGGAWHPEEPIYGGVGIGAGWRGLCQGVTISGGTVVAVGNQPAAGIGSSREGYCADISITGGRVSAEGGLYGPGIGAGVNGQCADITIGSGIFCLTAIRGPIYEVDTIGKGDGGICGTITIAPEIAADMTYGRMRFLKMVDLAALVGNVTIANGMTMTGRLKGNYKVSIADGARVGLRAATIYGVNDVAYPWAGLTCLGSAEIYLTDVNTVRGFHQNYPGIYVPKGSELKIRDLGWGMLTARSNGKAAGIGAGIASDVATCGDIDIGGNVHITAVGGANAAGIGSAQDSGNCGVINIGTVNVLKGSVTATCGTGAGKPIGAGTGGSPIVVAVASGLIDTLSGSTRKIVPSDGNLALLESDKTFEDGAVLTGTLKGNYKISIADGATVTLFDVSINGVNDSAYSWAGITCLGDATIILDGKNTVSGFYERCPGIYVPEGKTLTINGEGSLDASSNGDRAAGIGGGWDSCGNIVIEGGTIVATGGSFARGIGGGSEEACGSIRIGSGITSVTAFPGIGEGYGGTGGDVEIGDYIDTEISSDASTYIFTTSDLSRLTGDKTFHTGARITGTLSEPYKISIAAGALVALEDVTIVDDLSNVSWAGITCEGFAMILLSGKNYVYGFGQDYPGIYVPVGGLLTILGNGYLEAACRRNGRGAGIGGGYKIPCGNIQIAGGTVVATGGDNAAGIGSGGWSSCSLIGIQQAVVRATGGLNSPGIGAGTFGSCGNISIFSGTVEATGDGYGAGIGTGHNGVSCGNITIGASITRVTATCGNDIDTPIGKGGYSGEVGEISIPDDLDDTTSGKTRTLQQRNLALLKEDRTLTDGATITGTLAANVKISIAGGATVTLRDVTIEGKNDSKYKWAGITCEGDATIILEGENAVRGFFNDYPGIYVKPGYMLTIMGDGSLDASSNGNGAGIGGGYNVNCGNIAIEGGTIVATGGDSAAGIGGGFNGYCGGISILGGSVSATGGDFAAGIGGGEGASCGAIVVGADVMSVVATSGSGCDNPIGVGFDGTGGALTVASGLSDKTSGSTRTIESIFARGAAFDETDVVADEGGTITVVVSGGGNPTVSSSAKVYLTYHTAAAADLDLAKGTVNGVTPKGGLKFPLALAWEAGDDSTRTISIPVKTDKAVEDDEILSLQLAETVGIALGDGRLCTVKIHDPAYDDLAAKIAAGTATKAEQSTWDKLQKAKAPYIRGLADNADGGKVTGSGLCAEGKKVTLKAKANKNFTFLGWKAAAKGAPYLPTGDYVATTASLVIDRTTKPAANTKTSTTLVGVTEDTTYYAVFESYPEVAIAAVATDAVGANPTGKGAGKYVAGTVTGMGKYAPGKKVTVKATAAKSATTTYVFCGWYEGETLLSQAASYSFEMPSADVALTAKFITAAEDAAGVSATIAESLGFSSLVPKNTTSVPAGVYLEWPLAVKALSSTTVKVSGLPAGLKFAAKDIMKKGSKTEVEIPANTIYGVPTTAQNATVTIAITTSGKTKVEYTLDLMVTPMASWAVGTFDGAGADGVGTLSITAAGKISGKYIGVDGRTWTLSADGFDTKSSSQYTATLVAKSGKDTDTFGLTVMGHLVGGVASLSVGEGWVVHYTTNWKVDPWKGIASKIAKTQPYEYQAKDEAGNVGTITLKFAASGKVTAKGVFGSNSVSCSTVIVPKTNPDSDESFGLFIYVCFPQKGNFAGYCGAAPLSIWTGTKFE